MRSTPERLPESRPPTIPTSRLWQDGADLPTVPFPPRGREGDRGDVGAMRSTPERSPKGYRSTLDDRAVAERGRFSETRRQVEVAGDVHHELPVRPGRQRGDGVDLRRAVGRDADDRAHRAGDAGSGAEADGARLRHR